MENKQAKDSARTSRNDEHTARKRAPLKVALTVAGTLAVILGAVGIFVPLLPTTPFLLLAATCFTRSSDRLYDWLLNHKWFGTYIRNYREHRAITVQSKILAILLLWSTMGYTMLAIVASWFVRGLLFAIAAGVTLHLLKLKTLTREMVETQRAARREREPTG